MKQTVTVETAASPDVLARVAMLLARGNLSVADWHAEQEGVRFHVSMTLAAESERQLHRFVCQAEKLIDVYSAIPCSEKRGTAGQN